MEGASTIRAYNMQSNFRVSNMNKIDVNTVDFFALRYCNMWYGLRLDFVGSLLVLVTYMVIAILHNFFPASLTTDLGTFSSTPPISPASPSPTYLPCKHNAS